MSTSSFAVRGRVIALEPGPSEPATRGSREVHLANPRARKYFWIAALLIALLGFVGTVAMWFVGTRLGSVDIQGLSATTTTDLVVEAPLRVGMPSMFLMWPLGAALVVTVLALGDWIVEVRSARRGR